VADEIPFREIVRNYAAEKRANSGPHPDELDLALYAEDRLPADRRESIANHLVWCPDCNETLAIIEIPHDPDRENHPLVPMKPRRKPIAWMTHLTWAAVVISAIGVTLLLEPEAREQSYGVYQVPLSSETTRGEQVIAVPPSFTRVMLELDALVSGDDGPFLVEVVSEAGTVRIPTAPGRGGRFAVGLPVTALAPGPVEIRLLAGEGDARRVLATYPARVEFR